MAAGHVENTWAPFSSSVEQQHRYYGWLGGIVTSPDPLLTLASSLGWDANTLNLARAQGAAWTTSVVSVLEASSSPSSSVARQREREREQEQEEQRRQQHHLLLHQRQTQDYILEWHERRIRAINDNHHEQRRRGQWSSSSLCCRHGDMKKRMDRWTGSRTSNQHSSRSRSQKAD